MHNAFGKLVTLGLLGSGFFATGDLGWLARRGRQFLDASTVPAEATTAADAWPEPAPRQTSTTDGAPTDRRVEPAPPALPVPWYASRPPTGGPAFVELARLEPGSRLFLWVAAGPAHASNERCIALDIVDPAGGEALMHRGVEPPRRVVIVTAADGGLFASREPSGRICVRETVRVVPTGLAHAGTRHIEPESIGPVVALAIGQ